MQTNEVYVFDAGLILNDFNFVFTKPNFYTTNEIVNELKDIRARTIFAQGMRGGYVTISEPSKNTIKKVEVVAASRGLRVSQADISIIALAIELRDMEEKNPIVITDDIAVKILAKNFALKTEGVYFLK
jgi:rRNA maturation endonuclease Nob1